MTDFLERLLDLPAWLVYLVAFSLVFVEDALFIGFVIPGETAALLAGVAANQGNASLTVSILVVVVAAILGDTCGYEVGRIFGPRLLKTRLLRGHADRLQNARSFLERRGGWAVFFGRFTAFFRAVMPALAGVAGMHYRRFVAFNAFGGIVWGAGVVVLGYLAGESYEKIGNVVGKGTAGIAVAVIVVLLVVRRIRKGRAERNSTA